MKIAIVDDHILFREGLISLVSHQPDMSVVGEGGSVQEAIELSRSLQPEIILMDFSLPDGTGLDAAEVILKERPETRIIFLTIYDDDERLFSAIRMGAKGFLMKNIPVARLLAALRGVQRGEAALSREMTARLMDAFSQINPPSTPVPEAPFSVLTPRELEVLQELAKDATNRQIADWLFISENTVRNHVHNILEKLRISNRREAINLAHQNGLGTLPPPKIPPKAPYRFRKISSPSLPYSIGIDLVFQHIGRLETRIDQEGSPAVDFKDHDPIRMLVEDQIAGNGVVNYILIGRKGVVSRGDGRIQSNRIQNAGGGIVTQHADIPCCQNSLRGKKRC